MFDILDTVVVLKSSDISFNFDKPNMEPDLKQINVISMNAVCGKAPGVHVVKDLKWILILVVGTRQHNMVRC